MSAPCPACGGKTDQDNKMFYCLACGHRWRKSVWDPYGGRQELIELERRRRPSWARDVVRVQQGPTAATFMYPHLASDADMKG
jgi:hypothetical protein